MDYSDEPEVVFSPLTDKDYCDIYNLEMDNFSDDYPFYHARLKDNANILELGCGSGRLTRFLAKHCNLVTGLDISSEMIGDASKKNKENISYVCQDMQRMSFSSKFDTIIIPYNTINLLGSTDEITHCLTLCNKYLQKDGDLLFQAFLPSSTLLSSAGEKLFQFMILTGNDDNKIIKETIKYFDPNTKTLFMEERYRIRPMGQRDKFRDLRHTYTLHLPTLADWQQLLAKTGFTLVTTQQGYSTPSKDTTNETVLLTHATLR